MNSPLPKLYTSADAALFLGVKVCTVRNECRLGRLGFVTIGRRLVRHTEEQLVAYVKNREVLPNVKTEQPAPMEQTREISWRPTSHNRTDRQFRDAISALAEQTFAPKGRRTSNRKDAA